MQTRALIALAGREHHHRFHRIDVDDFDTPSDAAVAIRHDWKMSPGPAIQLIKFVEAAGGLVLVRDLGARELDAVTQWVDGAPPLFLINSHAPVDRFRFSLAHELGHVILHQEPGVLATQERNKADEFASEFLMPADSIRTELKEGRLDLPRLLDLKHKWGVSMAALLRRASTLGVVTDWQYRNLMVEMSALGYRTKEPSTGSLKYHARYPTPVTFSRMTDTAFNSSRTLQVCYRTSSNVSTSAPTTPPKYHLSR